MRHLEFLSRVCHSNRSIIDATGHAQLLVCRQLGSNGSNKEGYGGSAIIWRLDVDAWIKELPTDRFITIEYSQPWKQKPLVIISVHMPARSNAESEV